MNSIIYKFINSYVNKYFKNIEHLDLSIIDSKLKIDSIVPHAELFTSLLKLDAINLKIESGIIKDLIIEFPLNFMKNHIRINCKRVDIYLSEAIIANGKGSLLDHASTIEKSEEETIPQSPTNSSPKNKLFLDSQGKNIVNSISNSPTNSDFWDSIKEDIVANLIIKIENVNVYYFNKDSILKLELVNCLYSPSELKQNNENEFDFLEMLIDSKLSFRKCLIIEQIRASIQSNLKDNTNMSNYFLKNMSLVLCLDTYKNDYGDTKNLNLNVKKIYIDNFLFDYDVLKFSYLVEYVKRYISQIQNNQIKKRTRNNNNSEIEESSGNHETHLILKNSNVNFYHNKDELLLYFVIEFFNFKIKNAPSEDVFTYNTNNIFDFYFSKIFLFVPLIISPCLKSTRALIETNNNNFIKLILKCEDDTYSNSFKQINNSDVFCKKISLNIKTIIGKEKKKLFADVVYFTFLMQSNFQDSSSVESYTIKSGNIIINLDLNDMPIILNSLKKFKENIYIDKLHNQHKTNLIITNEIESNLKNKEVLSQTAKSSNDIHWKLKIPNCYIHFGTTAEFNDCSIFVKYVNFKLNNFNILYNSCDSNSQVKEKKLKFSLHSHIDIEIVNLLTQKMTELLKDLHIRFEISNNHLLPLSNAYNLFVDNLNININAYSINFLKNITNAFSSFNEKFLQIQISSFFFSKIKNCTSYVFEILYLNENLTTYIKPNEEKEIYFKEFKLKFSINDKSYENVFDISQLFLSLFNLELYGDNSQREVIDYIKIELKNHYSCTTDDADPNSKIFNLFFRYDQGVKSQINLFLFDNIIMIHSFPSLNYGNLFRFITNKANEISSVEKVYNENYLQNVELTNTLSLLETKFGKRKLESPVISFLCDNIMFINYLTSEIEIEITYEDKKEVLSIPPKEEKSLMIFFDKVISLNFVMKNFQCQSQFQNQIYYSEDIKNNLDNCKNKKISQSTQYNLYGVKMLQKVKSNLIQNNFFLMNYTVEDLNKTSMFNFNSNNFLHNKNNNSLENSFNPIEKINVQSPMHIIKIMPNLIVRNLTSSSENSDSNSFPQNKFKIFFVVNNFSDKIKNNFVKCKNYNQAFDEFQYELENNLNEISSRGDSSYFLNQNTDTNSFTKFFISQIKFGIKFLNLNDEEENMCKYEDESKLSDYYFFSEKIVLDNLTNNDFILGISLNFKNLFFMLRVNVKAFSENLVSITLSSFLNFTLTKDFELEENLVIRNTNDNLKFLNFKKIDKNSEINFDTLYTMNDYNRTKSFILNMNDILNFVSLLNNFKNDLEILINSDYAVGINIKDLLISENYQLNSRNSTNSENKIKNKIFNIRVTHYPFFICEIFDTHLNLKNNFYLFIENETEVEYYLTIKTKKENEKKLTCTTKSINEYSLQSELEIFSVSGEKDGQHEIYLIKNGYEISQKNLEKEMKKFNDPRKIIQMKIISKMNNIFLTIQETENSNIEVKENSETFIFGVLVSNINISLNMLPFFVSSIENYEDFKINLKAKKIFANYIHNEQSQHFNVSVTNIEMYNYITSSVLNKETANKNIQRNKTPDDADSVTKINRAIIMKTNYMTDVKFELNKIKFGKKLNANYQASAEAYKSINFINLKINFPMLTQIAIYETTLQIAKYFLTQLSKENIKAVIEARHANKILSLVKIPKIENVYNINEIAINDFALNFNIEYRKGLNFSIKNSKVFYKHSKINNIIGPINTILNELKGTFFKNFLTNLYNLFKSTELFGNFNQLFEEIKSGFERFKEKPFTTGIISLFYSSIKGGFNSVYGIGKSITKSIQNIKSSNYECVIYKKHDQILNDVFFLEYKNNFNLVLFNFIKNSQSSHLRGENQQISPYFTNFSGVKKNLENFSNFYLESFLVRNFSQFSDFDCYKIKSIFICSYKNEMCLLFITNYFICVFKSSLDDIKIESLIPFKDIKNFRIISYLKICIIMQNESLFEFNSEDGKLIKFIKKEILDKFE